MPVVYRNETKKQKRKNAFFILLITWIKGLQLQLKFTRHGGEKYTASSCFCFSAVNKKDAGMQKKYVLVSCGGKTDLSGRETVAPFVAKGSRAGSEKNACLWALWWKVNETEKAGWLIWPVPVSGIPARLCMCLCGCSISLF